ncbi:MAG TPA: response regulator transcription factor [Amycolatopsis sp.]|uniref:response regulator transcription factor n=1 Tax=Amycolatopsis sp. TaxID=37632 RepID=UPI002B4816DD|nr:response regulator transcription factor [Amycolatopsis sp.]HKS46450.1 response regulator transcription factor [Amycolatopsis sp.]
MNATTVIPEQGRVLIVDDESCIMTMMGMALRFLGYEVELAVTGRAGLSAAITADFDVILLDVVLPDLDGFEVCRRLREGGVEAPVLFVSTRDNVEDKVRGLDLGDDYVTKPFDPNEVVARVKALQRRGRYTAGENRQLRVGWVELDQDSYQVRAHGSPVVLSVTEFRLLRYLLVNAGRVITRAQILDHVWSHAFNGETGVVETYVYNLRRKLGDVNRRLIRTVRGVGYMVHGVQDMRP